MNPTLNTAAAASLPESTPRSTALLVDQFYGNYLEERMWASRALREAQIWLRDKVTRPIIIERLESLVRWMEEARGRTPRWSEESALLDQRVRRMRTPNLQRELLNQLVQTSPRLDESFADYCTLLLDNFQRGFTEG